MLVINNKKFINKVNCIFDKGTNRHLMNNKKVKYYTWVEIGSAFLMTEILASYLYPQIKDMKNIFTNRSKIYLRYIKKLSYISKDNFLITNNYKYKYNFHALVLVLGNTNREKFISYLKRFGINAVISYMPLHKSIVGRKYHNKKTKLINTDLYVKKVVRLPLHNFLKNKEVDFICKKINNYFFN